MTETTSCRSLPVEPGVRVTSHPAQAIYALPRVPGCCEFGDDSYDAQAADSRGPPCPRVALASHGVCGFPRHAPGGGDTPGRVPFAVERAGDIAVPWPGFWPVAVARNPGGLDHRGKRLWGRADAVQSSSKRISGGWHDALCPQRPSGPAGDQCCAPNTSWFSTSLISVGGGVSCSAARDNT